MTALAHLHDLFAGWGVGLWALFVAEVAVSIWVLWLCVRWTLAPREDAPDHVKRSILDDDDRGGVIVVQLTRPGARPASGPRTFPPAGVSMPSVPPPSPRPT